MKASRRGSRPRGWPREGNLCCLTNPELQWRLHPNGGRVAVVAVSGCPLRLLLRGWLTINGQKATIEKLIEYEPLTRMHTLRVQFEVPYPDPHP